MKPCLPHPGAPNSKGYVARYYKGRMEQVHRIAWIEAHGPIPAGFEVDHVCRNPPCYELSHLRLLTHQQNLLAGDTIVASQAAQTHCVNGHPFDASNTYLYTDRKGSTHRYCRACKRARRSG